MNPCTAEIEEIDPQRQLAPDGIAVQSEQDVIDTKERQCSVATTSTRWPFFL